MDSNLENVIRQALADAMLEHDDMDGYAVWKRVLRAVEEIQRS